jgi:porphobilinogen synthase
MFIRPRRNRQNEVIRSMVRESFLTPAHIIAPLFVIDGKDQKIQIKSMPGYARLSIDHLILEARELYSLGIKSVALFPAIEEGLKTSDAREAYNEKGLNARAIAALKEALPDMMIMGDIALDPYSSDGHDGLVDSRTGEILNDATLEVLAKQAICEARAGVDIIGPSDMMLQNVSRI